MERIDRRLEATFSVCSTVCGEGAAGVPLQEACGAPPEPQVDRILQFLAKDCCQ